MSSPLPAVEHFACDQPVLVASESQLPVFVAAPADRLNAERLERLERLSRGLVVLGLEDAIVQHLQLPVPDNWTRSRLDLPFTASIDATRRAGAGWSPADRSLTMRIAADPRTGPCDLAIPGHVHPVCIRGDELPARGGAASAAVELARIAGRRPAVALSAVVDRDGEFVSLAAGRASRELSRLPVASTEELRAIKPAERAALADVDCELPTRAGLFRVLAHREAPTGEVTVALVHGDPASRPAPLVHVHRACLLADVFASLLCPCRPMLDRAISDMVLEGAGICLYSKPHHSGYECGRTRPVDAAAIAGLIRAVGVSSLRLQSHDEAVIAQLSALGLAIATAGDDDLQSAA